MKSLNEKHLKVYNFMKSFPIISLPQLRQNFPNMSERQLTYCMERLIEGGLAKRTLNIDKLRTSHFIPIERNITIKTHKKWRYSND